jgi:hypothetical protein
MRRMVCVLVLVLFAGCASGFREEHYFRATDRRTGETVNYFRLTVQGRDGGTASRFVAGLYDERAVNYFFNEIRTGETLKPLLATDVRDSGDLELRPLGREGEAGAFVLILSTNAKSVADTLGEFAENQLIADAMTNLINRDSITESRRFGVLRRTGERRGESVRGHLTELFKELQGASDRAAAHRLLLQIARTIGASGEIPVAFESIDEVSPWVKTQLSLVPRDGQ